MDDDQTLSITFSNLIIFFCKYDTHNDAVKIIFDAYRILQEALKNDIAIKGSISFGEITVDFEKSLFFGQPIIDAYLLHEELQMLTVVLDNHAEFKINSFSKFGILDDAVITKYKTNLK